MKWALSIPIISLYVCTILADNPSPSLLGNLQAYVVREEDLFSDLEQVSREYTIPDVYMYNSFSK